MIYLSILIATLETRQEQFSDLYNLMEKQINDNNLNDEVEILVFPDNYDYAVGLKRNTLLSDASGLFTVFIDDDDLIPDDYVKTIVDIIKQNPDIDCIGFKGLLISEDLGNKEFIHSIKYRGYSEDENYYYRPPNHLNPIRSDISKRFAFPIINAGEDFEWAMQILRNNVLRKEFFIDRVMYYYRFEWSKTAAQRILDVNK